MMSESVAAILIALFFLAGCVTAPYTGRGQLMLVSESDEIGSGEQAYRQIMRDSVLSDNSETMRIVRRVGERIARAANKPDYNWEFRVINDSETINAFCVPGGKVAVYTGIFPIAKDEAGLAVILGHEVAHALLRHSYWEPDWLLRAPGALIHKSFRLLVYALPSGWSSRLAVHRNPRPIMSDLFSWRKLATIRGSR